VLATVLFSYWDSGQPNIAAAIAVVMMLVLGLTVLMARMTGFYGRSD